MIDVLNFIFASWGHFLGTLVLLAMVAGIASMIGPFVVHNHD